MANMDAASHMLIVKINGRFFWKGDERFVVKGLVYQPDLRKRNASSAYPDDPLRDDRMTEFRCDLELFKELGINTIYVYTIYLNHEHDQCMKLLAEAGIYVIAVLSETRCCINRMDARNSYTPELFAQYAKKVDLLSRYPNVIGVCVASNLVNKQTNAKEVVPVLRSLVNDLKTHMHENATKTGQRLLPISVSDDSGISKEATNFDSLTKPINDEMTIDFYMFNCYSPASGPAESRWEQAPLVYSHSEIPIVVSEYGCNVSNPRTFDEFDTLYSEKSMEVLSGGCVYEYRMAANAFGIAKILKDGTIEKLPDFYAYKEKLQSLK